MIPEWYDFKNPDYCRVFEQRKKMLATLRAKPELVKPLKLYYRTHIPQFICDWGTSIDPRNVAVGRPVLIPFILFPRQIEWMEWVLERWQKGEPGVSPKSRESGLSWTAIALSCSLCLFHEGMAIGFGSRKEEYVDKIGAPKSLFWKARQFVEMLPSQFNGGFNSRMDAPYMRIMFRETGAIMTGEAGSNIGRGDRTAIYFVDEAAFLEQPETTDLALSQTTNCRIDISTAHGIGNPFHRKVMEWPAERVFRFHWRDDPRKDQAWYDKQVNEQDPVTIAQELDIDFAASIEGVLIPSTWVQAAVDAHIKLGIKPSGAKFGALDVADEGKDKNAFCGAYGFLIECLEEWSGKGDDIFGTVQKAFSLCDQFGYDGFLYDADGLGAGVRGDARVINEFRSEGQQINADVFRGSGEVLRPTAQDAPGRINKDFFYNRKAQGWWCLRKLFQATYRAVVEGKPYEPDEIISIPKGLSCLAKLCMELSQPTYGLSATGKVVVDKAPEGTKSPNLADAVMIRFSGQRRSMMISDESLEAAALPSW